MNFKRLCRTVQEKKETLSRYLVVSGYVLHEEDVLLECNEKKVVVISDGSQGGARAHFPLLRVWMTGRSATGYIVLGFVYD